MPYLKGCLATLMCSAALPIPALAKQYPQQHFVGAKEIARYADQSLVKAGFTKSPLRREMLGIVRAAQASDVSPFLLLAIAGDESTFGQAACGGNAWGWGSCSLTYSNFSQGARAVAKGLRDSYLPLGSLDAIAAKYCPPTSTAWASHVRYFLGYFKASEGLHWADAVATVTKKGGGR